MLETLRLIFDSGLLVLIWIVQLIVYPSFSHYKLNDLYRWHKTYTKRIALIVIPLMLGQLITVILQVVETHNGYTVLSSVLVLLVWLSTFRQFVPLHNNVSEEHNVAASVKKLNSRNWLRTMLWTLLFGLSVYFQSRP